MPGVSAGKDGCKKRRGESNLKRGKFEAENADLAIFSVYGPGRGREGRQEKTQEKIDRTKTGSIESVCILRTGLCRHQPEVTSWAGYWPRTELIRVKVF
jgi:hypothetical protein